MASRRVRLRYWSVDIRQFMFWIVVAFVAGAGPNLAQLIHPLALVGLTAVAAAIAFFIWYRDRRKDGIGVYIHFIQPNRAPGQDLILRSVRSWMEKHHRDWFRAGPDRSTDDLEKRVDVMLASIRHRLDEIESWAGGIPPLFLYVQCGLPEAFTLGQRMAHEWGLHQLMSTHQEPSSWVLSPIDCHIRAMSHHSPEKPYHLNLRKAMIARGVGNELVNSVGNELVNSDDGTSSAWTTGTLSTSPHRLAVLVYAAPDSSDHKKLYAFTKAAKNAASGGAASGYLIRPDDVCDRTLVIRVSITHLLDAFNDENGMEAAAFIVAIRDHWENFARQNYGTTDVPVRLFIKGPAILAFALAAIFPADSRLVPWTSSILVEPHVESVMPEVVAIVDGDDVGAGMERELLSGNLETAIEYSQKMDSTMILLVERVSMILGTKVLSTGGDSAIFTMPQAALRSFERSLEQARVDLGYRFSCGYGPNPREAFVALRAAKASGKNMTIGPIRPNI